MTNMTHARCLTPRLTVAITCLAMLVACAPQLQANDKPPATNASTRATTNAKDSTMQTTRTQNETPMNMNAVEPKALIVLKRKQPAASSQIEFAASGLVRLQTDSTVFGKPSPQSRQAMVAPQEFVAITRLIAQQGAVKELAAGDSGADSMLTIHDGGSNQTTLHWAAASETLAQTQARIALARVGHLRYALASELFAKASALGDSKLLEQLPLLYEAILALDDSYASQTVLDDTGRKLMLARLQMQAGKQTEAAQMLRTIAAERLKLYEAATGVKADAVKPVKP
jgi:hypothetical protein